MNDPTTPGIAGDATAPASGQAGTATTNDKAPAGEVAAASDQDVAIMQKLLHDLRTSAGFPETFKADNLDRAVDARLVRHIKAELDEKIELLRVGAAEQLAAMTDLIRRLAV